jgi:uncharacterized membrane protein HdeD (DUF308 family)
MTAEQVGGILSIIIGILAIALRRMMFVGREEDVHFPENNLANPQRPPTATGNQRLIVVIGLIMIIAGILYAVKWLPR